MKSKYSFVILVLMCFVLAGFSIVVTTTQEARNEHKFCDVFGALIAVPAQKPADPKADPSRERSYILYEKFVRLDKSLGC